MNWFTYYLLITLQYENLFPYLAYFLLTFSKHCWSHYGYAHYSQQLFCLRMPYPNGEAAPHHRVIDFIWMMWIRAHSGSILAVVALKHKFWKQTISSFFEELELAQSANVWMCGHYLKLFKHVKHIHYSTSIQIGRLFFGAHFYSKIVGIAGVLWIGYIHISCVVNESERIALNHWRCF